MLLLVRVSRLAPSVAMGTPLRAGTNVDTRVARRSPVAPEGIASHRATGVVVRAPSGV